MAATARDIAGLDDLAAKYGEAILPIQLDVTDRDADFAAVKLAHDYFGRLDVIVRQARDAAAGLQAGPGAGGAGPRSALHARRSERHPRLGADARGYPEPAAALVPGRGAARHHDRGLRVPAHDLAGMAARGRRRPGPHDRRSVVDSPAGMGDEAMQPTRAPAHPETIEDDERPVHQWHLAQLARLGIPRPLADVVADHVDWHEIAALVQRGCAPRLALRIVR